MTAAQLVVVLPTFNERDNVAAMVSRLDAVLGGISWEAIFVDDDSTDGTREILGEISRRDSRIRFIHRIGRRGLSSACIEGMLASDAPLIAVMDADQQHDEALLPEMVRHLSAGEHDLVVGSRYIEGGGLGDWNARRAFISRFATLLGQKLLKVCLSDPMSGYFMLRRELLDRSVRRLSGKGFKILLDLVASAKGHVRVKELPFVFRVRVAGESKLDTLIAYEFALMLYDKMFGHVIPSRFLMFISVGFIGALLHLSVLKLALGVGGVSFATAQAIATCAAIVLNFLLNNLFTHRDRRLKGRALVLGLGKFLAVCGAGAVASVGIGDFLYGRSVSWWAAGLLGGVVGAVWNYSVSLIFVWGRRSA